VKQQKRLSNTNQYLVCFKHLSGEPDESFVVPRRRLQRFLCEVVPKPIAFITIYSTLTTRATSQSTGTRLAPVLVEVPSGSTIGKSKQLIAKRPKL